MNRSHLRPLSCGALTLATITILVGCVNAPADDVLATGESVVLPASVGPDQLEAVVADTARLLGEDSDGHTFYVVEASEESGSSICLLVDGVEHGPMMACGAMPLGIETDDVRARLSVEVTPEDEGEKIGEYLRVFL